MLNSGATLLLQLSTKEVNDFFRFLSNTSSSFVLKRREIVGSRSLYDGSNWVPARRGNRADSFGLPITKSGSKDFYSPQYISS